MVCYVKVQMFTDTHRVDCLFTILNSVICHLCVKMQSSRDMWWTGHIHSIMVEMPPLKNLLVFAVICLFVFSLLQTINDMWRRNIKPTHSSSRIRKSQYKSIDCSRPYNRIYDLSRSMSTVAVLLLLWVFLLLCRSRDGNFEAGKNCLSCRRRWTRPV